MESRSSFVCLGKTQQFQQSAINFNRSSTKQAINKASDEQKMAQTLDMRPSIAMIAYRNESMSPMNDIASSQQVFSSLQDSAFHAPQPRKTSQKSLSDHSCGFVGESGAPSFDDEQQRSTPLSFFNNTVEDETFFRTPTSARISEQLIHVNKFSPRHHDEQLSPRAVHQTHSHNLFRPICIDQEGRSLLIPDLRDDDDDYMSKGPERLRIAFRPRIEESALTSGCAPNSFTQLFPSHMH